MATARPTSSPVLGSVEDAGSAEDEVVLEALDDVVLLDVAAVAELLVEEVVAGPVDELEDVVLGAEGVVLVELEWLPDPDEPDPPSGSTYC